MQCCQATTGHSTWQCFRHIVKNESVSGLYKGQYQQGDSNSCFILFTPQAPIHWSGFLTRSKAESLLLTLLNLSSIYCKITGIQSFWEKTLYNNICIQCRPIEI